MATNSSKPGYKQIPHSYNMGVWSPIIVWRNLCSTSVPLRNVSEVLALLPQLCTSPVFSLGHGSDTNNRTIQRSILSGVTAALGSSEVLTQIHDNYTRGTDNNISKTHVYFYSFLIHSCMISFFPSFIHLFTDISLTLQSDWSRKTSQASNMHKSTKYICSERRKERPTSGRTSLTVVTCFVEFAGN